MDIVQVWEFHLSGKKIAQFLNQYFDMNYTENHIFMTTDAIAYAIGA
ncbi:hypothetical protein [Clostridium sp. BJN0013]